jgi:glucose-1-phosphate thymidylyltransferase
MHFLLEGFRQAGIETAHLILAPGKWDIPELLGSGKDFGLQIAYLVRDLPYGVPFTVDAATPFVAGSRIAFGFPDIVFRPAHAVAQLALRQQESQADVVLGLFPVEEPDKWDAVVLDDRERILDIVTRPHGRREGRTWILSVWSEVFTRYLHAFVEREAGRYVSGSKVAVDPDVPMGAVMKAALSDGLSFEYIWFDDGFCLDVGTPEDLIRARELPF